MSDEHKRGNRGAVITLAIIGGYFLLGLLGDYLNKTYINKVGTEAATSAPSRSF